MVYNPLYYYYINPVHDHKNRPSLASHRNAAHSTWTVTPPALMPAKAPHSYPSYKNTDLPQLSSIIIYSLFILTTTIKNLVKLLNNVALNNFFKQHSSNIFLYFNHFQTISSFFIYTYKHNCPRNCPTLAPSVLLAPVHAPRNSKCDGRSTGRSSHNVSHTGNFQLPDKLEFIIRIIMPFSALYKYRQSKYMA